MVYFPITFNGLVGVYRSCTAEDVWFTNESIADLRHTVILGGTIGECSSTGFKTANMASGTWFAVGV